MLLLSIIILSIPYVGFEYLRDLERYLRDSFESSLMDTARAFAAPLHEKEYLFPLQQDAAGGTIYVHDLTHPMQVDGYADDWLSYIDWSDVYSSNTDILAQSTSFRLIISRYLQNYYVLLQVEDSNLVYQLPWSTDGINNDHVILVFRNHAQQMERFHFSPAAPGKLRPYRYKTYEDENGFEYQTVDYITNITGVWQATDKGYNLEIAIPANLIGDRLGFVVYDVDDPVTRVVVNTIGTNGNKTLDNPGEVLQSSPEIKRIIAQPGQVPGRRIWVLDNLGRVLASTGSFEEVLPDESVNILYSLILPPVYERFQDDLAGASRLQGQEVKHALQGRTDTRWRTSPDARAVIVSAASPVRVNNEVRGVVVVEETTTGMQILQRRAMASLFNKTLAVFFIVTILLLLFATRLSYRIRQLSREAESAIDKHGRVIKSFIKSESNDELGELSRNYGAMLERLKEYNDYLENMAGRLSHELRTPIAVVQSSLEHLQSGVTPDKTDDYLGRARDGIERLRVIVTHLSEATRIEQALQGAEKYNVDIIELLQTCTAGYRDAYPATQFNISTPRATLHAIISPDLFVQMLDKLIANAVDFGTAEKPVEIELAVDEKSWYVRIINYGPGLPEVMEGQLFNSMVSVRGERDTRGPHLGLGLYIARLIAEYHNGTISAVNLSHQHAVMFEIKMESPIIPA